MTQEKKKETKDSDGFRNLCRLIKKFTNFKKINMKKQLVLMAFAAMFSITAANAQGGFQRRTVEERVKMVNDKFDSTFHFDAAKQAKIDSVFAEAYRAQDKFREEMMANGAQPDRDVMRTKMQELAEQRDEKLKGILSEEQMKKWKDELEPSMRPQRGNRPPGQK
ncbi:MAG: hypothetical protein ACKOU7_02660 [Ferruginibacter sp.]